MTTNPASNAEQIAYWNSVAARRWLDLDSKQDVVFAPITEALFERVARVFFDKLQERVLGAALGH